MSSSVVSALAALAGAIIGGLTSVLASWLAQRVQARALLSVQDKLRRQELYRDFIEVAAKAYVDALQHGQPDISSLVEVYAKISRMRVLSSPKVTEAADKIVRTIVDTYLEPDKTFIELREMVSSGKVDLLRSFSEVCREEFESEQL
jgi:hypothetical protein